VLLEDQDEGRP
jgi:hypothetical protein